VHVSSCVSLVVAFSSSAVLCGTYLVPILSTVWILPWSLFRDQELKRKLPNQFFQTGCWLWLSSYREYYLTHSLHGWFSVARLQRSTEGQLLPLVVLRPQSWFRHAKGIPIQCFVSHRPNDPFFWKSEKILIEWISFKEECTLIYQHTILSY